MRWVITFFLVALIFLNGCASKEVEALSSQIIPQSNKTIEQGEQNVTSPEQLQPNETKEIVENEAQKIEKLIPITFRVKALEADNVAMSFPVFWAEYQRDNVKMEKQGIFLEATVEFPKNSLIRYQYILEGKSWDEREQFEKDIEPNRMVLVSEPMIVSDKIYSWGAKKVEMPIKIYGKVIDKQGSEPVLDAVIVADGVITFPSGDGSYELNIRSGKHQIIAYLLDGSYKTQSKIIEISESIKEKEINFEMEKANTAKVTININANPPADHKVRIYSSAEQTGARFLYKNRFLTENFKTLENDTLTFKLYEGQYVDYLYTVGSPYIAFENKNGQHITRHFIATDGLIINDTLGNFTQKNTVDLTVKVPAYTDPNDVIGLEYIHPTPLFMHPKGNNEWTLKLSGYVNQGTEYRYYKGFAGQGNEKVQRRRLNKDKIYDIIDEWKLQDDYIKPYNYSPPIIKNKFDIFIYPYDYYGPGHARLMESLVDRISEKGFHGIALSQIWGYETLEPLPKISRDKPMTLYMPFYDVQRVSDYAHEKGLSVTMFPQLVGAESVLNEPKEFDEGWWNAWLNEMEKFNLYNARTAQAAGIEYLVFQSRQPGMNLPENYKETYNKRQGEILQKVRTIFKGKVIAAADLEEGIDYWKDADIVSEKIWDGLELDKDASQEEMDTAIENLLDAKYKPIYEKAGTPFLIDQLAYSAIDGAANAVHAPESEGPNTDEHLKYPLDTKEQRMIHESFYKAINERDWIIGVNLFGYGFTDTPESRDVDIRGKPAEDVASAWAKKIGKNN